MQRPSADASQYQREAQAYGQAYRLLKRRGRRGDVNAALELPNLMERARGRGFSTGGIRSSEGFRADTDNFERSQSALASERERRLNQIAGEGGLTSRTSVVPEMTESRLDRSPSRLANTPRNRLFSALDILEGNSAMTDETNPLSNRSARAFGTYSRGLNAARDLGVAEQAIGDLANSEDSQLRYRQLLDRAIGEATTDEEVDALRRRGVESGIAPEAFDRRASYWSNRRRLS